jgi:hypothetical protein
MRWRASKPFPALYGYRPPEIKQHLSRVNKVDLTIDNAAVN